MQLLHDAQKLDGKRAKKKKKEEQMKVDKENKLARAKAMNQKRQQPGQTFQQASTMHDARRGHDDGGDGDQDVGADNNATAGNAIKVSDEVDMIDALTGIPITEDELMFAVTMIGPWNAMTNYKFKVKVTPGTAKRGKAAKTTLGVFTADRAATTREKDLLKSLKDQDVSRNLPGKVKISFTGQQKSKASKESKNNKSKYQAIA